MSDNLWIAIVFTLPEFIIEDNHIGWRHAIRHVKRLNAPAKLCRHTEEAGCIAGYVGYADIFRQIAGRRGQSSEHEAEDAVDGTSFAKAVKLRWVEGEPSWNLRMLLVNHRRVHSALSVGIWKWMEKRGIDDAEDGSGSADAKSKRKNCNQ